MKRFGRGAMRAWFGAALIAWGGWIAQGQVIIRNFAGVSLDDADLFGTGSTPPDSMGAAGPDDFAEFVNGVFAVFAKDGTRRMLISETAFWEDAGISNSAIAAGLTDPRLAYDVLSGRWFASEITLELTGNQMLVACSDGSDPAGAWKALHFTVATGGFDFDTLAVDSNAVYLAANNFSAAGSLLGVALFCVPKSDLVTNTPTLTRMTRFNNLSASTYGFSPQGVSNPGGSSHGVIIAIDNVAFNFVDRTTVNNPAGTATLSARVRIPIAYDSLPNPAHQPGGDFVDTVDDRFTAAVRQVGSNIFMANTILQGDRDAVHWIVLRESNNSIVGEGIISDATFDYFQPSIAANSHGRFFLAFNRSGTSAPAGDISIYGAIGTVGVSGVTVDSPFVLRQGVVSNFAPSFDSAPYRWGDYSATTVDPNDDDLFWTIQEIPVSSGVWGTQITLISLATNPPSLAIVATKTNVLLSWPLSADPAFALQQTSSLNPTATWTNISAPITISRNQNVVSLAPPTGAKFFRLKK